MFEGWDSFYLLVGGGAGALIGLMFVVATLTGDLELKESRQGSRVFITPIVFHFGVVLVVSALSAVPRLSPSAVGAMISLLAALGFVYSATNAMRLFRPDWGASPDMSDKCFYGVLPALVYVGLAAAAGAVWFAPEDAPYGIGACMLALLLIGIRNAWDLATFFVQRPKKRQ